MNYLIKIIAFTALFITTNVSLASEKDAEQFVNSVASSIITIVTSKSSTESQKKSQITNIISTNFDISWMSKFVLGRNYKALSDSEKTEYEKLYLNYLVGNYFPILIKYDNDKFAINQSSKSSKTVYNIDTTIKRVDKPSVNINYRIKEVPPSLKAIDMIVEGISTIGSQRDEFNSTIQQDGLQGFMTKMKEKYS